ncbi:hypothetical protein DFP93_1344 [Aneurinibacillus soli]|uniref:Uncharacterized protein n=1 Tax=Aneurinibacillus soli TaxID=1500254 RepID=A0A0U5CA36_9BACL|nr:hypothetical protein [Aneurinibacillus soli]PYE57064.1 hypothetical protein DFP93_1344 [Aneurinibacillus soli]BAU29571.1 hypothetical protein CB4_03771 [Aneurinibacillus soli]
MLKKIGIFLIFFLVLLSSSISAAPAKETKQAAFIKKVYTSQGKTYITVDYVDFLRGEAAARAMREAGECDDQDGDCYPPDDYYIRNVNPKLRTFPLNKNVPIYVQKLHFTYDAPVDTYKKYTPASFKALSTSSKNYIVTDVPYWLTLKGDTITKIEEQFIP